MESEDEESKRELEDEETEEEDECAPPEEEKEMLFLIEFLVDTLMLKPENMDIGGMDPCLLQGQTCITLNFLHYPPMSICEKDVDPCKQTGLNYIKYNSGKSLMFALSESQFESPPPIYLDVAAHKMLPHGSVPGKLHIGATKICLVELFKQVFEKVQEKPDKLPLSKSIKDKYQLIGTRTKCPTAEVTIYIRLSCLGQNVVTEFQRGLDECDPFLFKSKESPRVYRCVAKDAEIDVADDLCPALPGWGLAAGRDCGDGGPPITAAQCTEGKKDPNQTYGAVQPYTSSRRGGRDAYLNPEDCEGDYEEFGTEVLGHALTIKVQKGHRRHLDESDTALGKPSTGKSRQTPNEISFQVPKTETVCNKGRQANKAELYNVGGQNGNKCGGPIQIVQGPDSPDKDIFILRIGKKGETSTKGKLELELRTPKPKVEKPNLGPKKVNKIVQTENVEQPKKKGKRGRK